MKFENAHLLNYKLIKNIFLRVGMLSSLLLINQPEISQAANLILEKKNA